MDVPVGVVFRRAPSISDVGWRARSANFTEIVGAPQDRRSYLGGLQFL
jgi:hypothetical protein